MPSWRPLAAAAATLGLFTCADEEALGPVSLDVEVDEGFAVQIVDGGRLVVAAADGRILLDGLPQGSVTGDGPPLVGFATRDLTTKYEMLLGAFKPSVTANGPWSAARSLRPEGSVVTIVGPGSVELALLTFEAPESGHLIVDLALPEGAAPLGDDPSRAIRLSWGFACDGSDHFAGFGAQTWDADHRGQTVPAFVTEGGIGKSDNDDYIGAWMLQGQRHSSHAPLPQYLSRRGYIATVESDRRSVFALCSESDDAARIEVDLPARLHLFDGPSPPEAVERATATFGRPRTPPDVAFAPWLDAIFGSANVRRVAQKLRDENIPVSVIWTEDWRGGEWAGELYKLKEEWEVDRTLYPDIEALADDLHGLGYHFHVYFNPFIFADSKAWQDTQPNGWLIKNEDGGDYIFGSTSLTDASMIDLDHPDARAWALGKMQNAIALGADGWMNDFAEWLPTDAVTAAGPAYERHNTYPVEWQRVAREAIDGASDGTERLFFARSGWFGTPELADVFWAGDQATTWEPDDGFPTLIPQAIGLGIVGISTYGHDIAGYQSALGPGSTKELFFRWAALGAWSPVMRTHHGAQPDKEWGWEKDAETTDHFRRYAALHMSLVPTLTALAAQASATGMPIWRGLALHFPGDARVWGITDQIMLGDGVLVCPVQTAGATSREVYLPTGRWYPFEAGPPTVGPVTQTAPAPVTEIPVFVRAGTILPMYPAGVMTLVNGSAAVPDASSVGDDRVLHVFLGASGGFSETGGLSYDLVSTPVSGDVTATFTAEGGTAMTLGACSGAALPCADPIADGVVALVGPGTLELTGAAGGSAALTIAGGEGTFEVRARR